MSLTTRHSVRVPLTTGSNPELLDHLHTVLPPTQRIGRTSARSYPLGPRRRSIVRTSTRFSLLHRAGSDPDALRSTGLGTGGSRKAAVEHCDGHPKRLHRAHHAPAAPPQGQAASHPQAHADLHRPLCYRYAISHAYLLFSRME